MIFGKRVKSLQDLFGDIFGDIARPAFGSVESNHPHGAIELAAHQIGDDGFPVGLFFVDLAPASAAFAEIVQHQINIDVIRQGRRDRGRTTPRLAPSSLAPVSRLVVLASPVARFWAAPAALPRSQAERQAPTALEGCRVSRARAALRLSARCGAWLPDSQVVRRLRKRLRPGRVA